MTWLVLGLVAALAGVSYYLLVMTEGTYLGARVVTLLYDWTARRYDRIKELQYVDEMRYLGIPLAGAVRAVAEHAPRVLDVAAGTGRVAQALLPHLENGRVVEVDRSLPMLLEGRPATWKLDGDVAMSVQDAQALAFQDGSFDAVTCLEALEFVADGRGALREMQRVLRPGGVLLVSSRVGTDGWLFPGRLRGRGKVERCLQRMGFERVTMERWQVHYDLVWAHKAKSAG
ncbi:MAG: class I SAM-dependent methyltransferase [Anaerolineae bacterium]